MENHPVKSRVLAKLRNGETAICFKNNLTCSRAVAIAAMAGFDCIWICNEHVPTDFSVMEAQINAAKMHGADIMVRVAKGSYNDFIRPLEADATAIMVPHLMSAQEARDIVRQTRFQPIGRRPLDGGNADGGFCRYDFKEYLHHANTERMVIVQIEDPEPLAELDEICQIEGIDMIFFGPGDFSHAIGDPGNFANPELVRAKKLVAETARKYGKFAGTTMGPGQIEANIELGYRFLCCGADVIGLNNYCDDIIAQYSKTGKTVKSSGNCLSGK